MTDACSTPDLERISERLRVLAEPNRLRLIAGMADGSGTSPVGELASCCAVDLSVVSRHLKALLAAGFVTSEKTGREVRYCCNRVEIAETLRGLADWIENCCPETGPAEKGETP